MCSYSSATPGRNQVWPLCKYPDGYTRPLCARGGIGRRARLRALWTEWSVVVQVHSSAWRPSIAIWTQATVANSRSTSPSTVRWKQTSSSSSSTAAIRCNIGNCGCACPSQVETRRCEKSPPLWQPPQPARRRESRPAHRQTGMSDDVALTTSIRLFRDVIAIASHTPPMSPLLEDAQRVHDVAGLSDRMIAAATGAKPSTVRGWLAGRNEPTDARAERLIEAPRTLTLRCWFGGGGPQLGCTFVEGAFLSFVMRWSTNAAMTVITMRSAAI